MNSDRRILPPGYFFAAPAGDLSVAVYLSMVRLYGCTRTNDRAVVTLCYWGGFRLGKEITDK